MPNFLSKLPLILCFWSALVLFFPPSAQAFMKSAFLGGFPGLCEESYCFDDGQPLSDPPPEIKRNILQHQLTSPTCPTDLVYIALEYPSNTGSSALDARIAKTMDRTFAQNTKQAVNLSCNDFEGCLGHCLPVGFEIKHYIQRPGPGYLSLFRVDRFIGTFRPNRHMRGTVDYKFENYSLVSGQPLKLKDIFVNPNKSVPLFWQRVEKLIKTEGSAPCSIRRYKVSGRSISNQRLEPGDFILTRGGATVAITNSSSPGACLSQAIDLSIQDMIDIGAYPALWGL
jgi:hypothetical protein